MKKLGTKIWELIKKRTIQALKLAILKITIKPEKHDIGWMIAGVLTELNNKQIGIKTKLLDGKYWTCSQKNFHAIIDSDWLNERKYILDRFDCDDFAFQVKARLAGIFGLNNVAIVINDVHAFNLIFFSDGSYSFFEPQNDSWIIDMNGMYKLENALIIF